MTVPLVAVEGREALIKMKVNLIGQCLQPNLLGNKGCQYVSVCCQQSKFSVVYSIDARKHRAFFGLFRAKR